MASYLTKFDEDTIFAFFDGEFYTVSVSVLSYVMLTDLLTSEHLIYVFSAVLKVLAKGSDIVVKKKRFHLSLFFYC